MILERNCNEAIFLSPLIEEFPFRMLEAEASITEIAWRLLSVLFTNFYYCAG